MLDNWTDEQFEAFWSARNHRIVAIRETTEPEEDSSVLDRRWVTDMELFAQMGIAEGSA
jgi:hypothetical protein